MVREPAMTGAVTPGMALVGIALGTPHSDRLAAVLTQQLPGPVRVLSEHQAAQESQWVLVDAAHLSWAQARWPQLRIVCL